MRRILYRAEEQQVRQPSASIVNKGNLGNLIAGQLPLNERRSLRERNPFPNAWQQSVVLKLVLEFDGFLGPSFR